MGIDSIERRALSSTISGGIFFLLTLLQSIFLVPAFLEFWGDKKYGTWLAIFAFTQLLRILDLGHQNFVGNEFIKAYYKDKQNAKHILGSSVRIAFLLGFIEFIIYIFILLSGNGKPYISQTIYNDNAVLYLGIPSMLIAWWLTGSIGGILVRIILPLGLYAKSVYISMIIKVLEILILTIAIFSNFPLHWVCILIAAANGLYSVFIFKYIKSILPDFYPWQQSGSWKAGFIQLKSSTVLTITNFIEQFNANGAIIIVSTFLSVSLVPLFTTVRTISNLFLQINMLLTTPMTPDLIKFYTLLEGRKIQQVIEVNWFITNLIVNVPILISFPFISNFFDIWTKGILKFDLSLYSLMICSVCIANFGRMHYTLLTGVNHLRALTMISVARIFLFFLATSFLIKTYGLHALGFGVLFSECFASIVIPMYFVNKELNNLGTHVKMGSIIFNALPLVLLCSILLGLNIEYKLITWVIGVLVLMIFSLLQWSKLDERIRDRLLNIVLNFFIYRKE